MILLILILIVVALGAVWYFAPVWAVHPATDGVSGKRWDRHSPWHLGIPAAISFVGTVLTGGSLWGVVAALVATVGWELIQRYPRDRGGGVLEVWDIVWGVAGSVGGYLAAGLLH